MGAVESWCGGRALEGNRGGAEGGHGCGRGNPEVWDCSETEDGDSLLWLAQQELVLPWAAALLRLWQGLLWGEAMFGGHLGGVLGQGATAPPCALIG